MPFVNAVQHAIDAMHPGSTRRLILEFLRDNARGRDNAQPWERIEAFLSGNDAELTKEQFQQGLLKSTREKEIFIGSSEEGYYLIQDRDDAIQMTQFYLHRMETERARLRRLNELARHEGWDPLPVE